MSLKSPNVANETKVHRELTRLKEMRKKEFTARDIAKRCNLKSPGAAGVMLQQYMAEFNLGKDPERGVYWFKEIEK